MVKKRLKKGRKYAIILGIKVDSTELVEVLNKVEDWIVRKRRFFITTPNPEIMMLAQHDRVLSSILNSSDICLPDGIGLVWASKWQARATVLRLGRSPLHIALKRKPRYRTVRGKRPNAARLDTVRQMANLEQARSAASFPAQSSGLPSPLRGRVSGVEIMEELVKLASKHGWRVFLLGGREGVAEKAAKNLTIRHTPLAISYDSGPWLDNNGKPIDREEERKEKEVIKKINTFRPYLLFVGFGAPKQEKWASRHLRFLDVNCVMVVGGAFDYLSGHLPRAPKLVRDLGFEWLFRLLVEPWRLKRQLALLKFAWAILRASSRGE